MSSNTRSLTEGWQIAQAPAGSCGSRRELEAAGVDWRPGVVPGTVATSLGTRLDERGDYDAADWWYRCEFDAAPASQGAARFLNFGGLATLADVWLNGELILSSRNMFLSHRLEVTRLVLARNELVICFRSLDAALAERKPRPRWKTALVSKQNLRWFRTTFLGRIPGWTPPIRPVGPWRAISLETVDTISIETLKLKAETQGATGIVDLKLDARILGDARIGAARLRIGEADFPLTIAQNGSAAKVTGRCEIPNAPLWWPHTHGEPKLLGCELEISTSKGATRVDCGRVAFKSIALDRAGGALSFRINGEAVFCRGACWTSADALALDAPEPRLRAILTAARDSGLNMIRVGGTMVYESDAFYGLCDELGILVWQDFMFANFDYPVTDPTFRAEIEREVTQQVERLSKHACIAAYCGGSEVQQQAAMMGLPQGEWSNDFFDATLPALCADAHPGIPYFPSTPYGGALPFHVSEGLAHYYGVGAYRRPITDVKHSGVRFTPECLGFSNVPEHQNLETLGDGAIPPPHDPRWKAGVPRDGGAGWDFEDVRDHYLRELFDVDPIALRSQDFDRYLRLSRAVSAEAMKAAFSEWRAPGSGCGGALVWFLSDLRPGAGWGLIDSDAQPKAAWHALRRAWAPQALLMTDEGLDGLRLHALNETARPLKARLSLELFSRQRLRAGDVARDIEIPARGALTVGADELLGHFTDVTNSYRFGPPKYDVVRASLTCLETGRLVSEDFYFPQGPHLPRLEHEGLEASAKRTENGYALTLKTPLFLQFVHLSAKGFQAAENYFHVAPGSERRVHFVPLEPSACDRAFKVEISALNLHDTVIARATAATPGSL